LTLNSFAIIKSNRTAWGQWLVDEGREIRFRGDLYSQESTFPLVTSCTYSNSPRAWIKNGRGKVWYLRLPCSRCYAAIRGGIQQEAQLSPSDRAMRLVSSNLANNLPRNSAETTYTTSPDQTDGMKLEV